MPLALLLPRASGVRANFAGGDGMHAVQPRSGRRRGLARARLLVLMASLALGAGAQAQYKWTDSQGRVAYGDQPPKDARQVEKLAAVSASGGATLDNLPFEIRRAANDFPVVLYVGADCQPCTEARNFLKIHNIPFSERSISSQADVAAFKDLGGAKLLPAVTIGRQMLHGFEAGAWSGALLIAGYPRDVPLPRDWKWAEPVPLAPRAPAAASDSAGPAADQPRDRDVANP